MQTDTVIIQYVNARDGKKPASIKDTSGNYYTISDAAFASGMFQPQTQGELTWVQPDPNKPWKYAKQWCGLPVPDDPKKQAAAPAPVQPGPRPVAQSLPKPVANGKSPDEQKWMYLTGVVGRAMGSGKFKAEDIPALSEWAEEGWKKLTEPKAPPAPPPPNGPEDYGMEADDEIPFAP